MHDVWECESSLIRLQTVDYLFLFVWTGGITIYITIHDINGATIIVEWVSSSHHPIYIIVTMFELRHELSCQPNLVHVIVVIGYSLS
jgi:hypothetical protein